MEIFKLNDYFADSIASFNNLYACSFSRKEGNIWDGMIVLINNDTSKYLERSVNSGIEMLCTSIKNNFIIIGCDDGCISLYNQDLILGHTISAHDDIISALVIDENSNRIVSGSWDGFFGIWDYNDGRITHLQTFAAHSGPINDISFQSQSQSNSQSNSNLGNQSSSLCCSVGQDGFLRIWDFRTSIGSNIGKCVSIASLNQIGSSCTWSQSNPYHIICGLEDGLIMFHDIRYLTPNDHNSPITLQYLHTHNQDHTSRINAILTSSNMNGYISASSNGSITSVVSSYPSSEYRKCYENSNTYPTDICWFEGSTDSLHKQVVSSWTDGSIRIINV